jgi:hypothetical protein
VTADRVLARNKVIGESSEKLWEYLQGLVARMVSEGYLPAGPAPAE